MNIFKKILTQPQDQRLVFLKQVKQRVTDEIYKVVHHKTIYHLKRSGFYSLLFFGIGFLFNYIIDTPLDFKLAISTTVSITPLLMMPPFLYFMIFGIHKTDIRGIIEHLDDDYGEYLIHRKSLFPSYCLNKEEIKQLFQLNLTMSEHESLQNAIMNDKAISFYQLVQVFHSYIEEDKEYANQIQKEMNLQTFLKENGMIEEAPEIQNVYKKPRELTALL